ncbi:RNA polymerase sigma-70 factor [Phytoactinopolyspora halotolerans]|uniref:RNA polymerase sigma-70 factor n=1 Tax=Phytoactinopolyspora halotolerans TaxID=1981512 RepID=A0A6L9S360_9ACTN|nr:RNA polymerase sigma-70 factor [Phytoactinopolyspora halotolerans]NED98857.1 RNA polymerase sigma-70 factor [Phytoactinopolyspora halotolerans]
MSALQYDTLRPLMFSIAYRMLGSVAEAEDVVQEAFLRMHKSELDGVAVDSPDAFATTVTTRLAIDALRSARVRREQYVGQWLPEPLMISDDADPAHRLEADETVSTAFLVLLESLSPLERAVFVLREAFGYEYADIAEIVEKSPANCRQILTRARRAIDERRPRFDPDLSRQAELSRGFLAAAQDGDMDALTRLLADDVVFVGDGGGKVPALAQPVRGPIQVARFLGGLLKQARRTAMRIDTDSANGMPAWRVHASDGALLAVMTMEIADGRIRALHNQMNPDKLHHLGTVGDLNTILGRTP